MNELMADKTFRIAAVSVLVLLALFLAVKTWNGAFGKSQFEPTNMITVEGTGEVSVVPDVAQITFTVTESATTVKAAQDAATKKTNDAIAAVEKLGVEKKDVKTENYSVSPKYEYPSPCPAGAMCAAMVSGTPKIVGYDVAQTVTVKVRNTDKAGDVLTALGGLNVQNIQGPNFMVDDEDAALAEARGKAIEEARAKAKVLAKQLGVSLGKVMSYNEGTSYPQPMMYTATMKAAGVMESRDAVTPNLPTGEHKSSVTVSVTYEIH